ncbi:MAG: hypothetical protein RL318_1172 [Fibrobacterota bacterium]|jgi:hypothetical protein
MFGLPLAIAVSCLFDSMALAQDSISAYDSTLAQIQRNKFDWRLAWDFDGDGINDTVWDEYSGGGHCCYTLQVGLSRSHKTIRLPFEMDGHYVGGLDMGMPDHFAIGRFEGSAFPQIFMEINTYNDEKFPISRKMTRQYGFRTNRILVSFENGRLKVRDRKVTMREVVVYGCGNCRYFLEAKGADVAPRLDTLPSPVAGLRKVRYSFPMSVKRPRIKACHGDFCFTLPLRDCQVDGDTCRSSHTLRPDLESRGD